MIENLENTLVGKSWSKIGVKHHHGIDLPLSALHSKNSCGIGEFYDLIPLIDWCQNVGMDVIQLLPLNDTGDDTSPFFALSALALNPLFISLYKLDGVKPNQLLELQHFDRFPRVPYHDVQSHKLHFLRKYFDENRSHNYKAFAEENDWVESYALFKVLKDVMAKNHWHTWPKELQQPSKALIEKYREQMNFYIFLQYLCFKQLKEVKTYANKRSIFLKGDIPILISPDSADVWEYAEEFDRTLVAGAPPDPFNPNGQVWGLPIFRWDVMSMRNYDWWRKRLSYATHFYDIYRIDHVLGFFRIYAIEQGKSGKDGKFIPENESEWLPHGENLLKTLCAFTPMLPIAEDLGVVPHGVRETLSKLGICGTKVVRWEETPPTEYNSISMTTISTHDSETLHQWWRNEPQEARAYCQKKNWLYKPSLSKDQRREILKESHQSTSLFHINLLGEYLALFDELVWENPDDERINVPGTISLKNWTNRIRPTVEKIIAHKPLAEEIRGLLK